MATTTETQDGSGNDPEGPGAEESRAPGLLLVRALGGPAAEVVPLAGGSVELGRAAPPFDRYPDSRISRHHARVSLDGGHLVVTDLRSRNGMVVDGKALAQGSSTRVSRALRLGDSLLVPVPDVAVFRRLGVRVEAGRVEGPALQQVLLAAASAATAGTTLHITGESGAGKEGVARAFHAASSVASGPFEAVNCATIPDGVAERLLFGAKRGAYSGADADADGYVQSADGGTLFLDEVAELSLAVQAKLLRLLETGEVRALGAARARRVKLRFCSATHRDLRAQVADGKLREDLYFRVASPRVTVPPLRDRPEEIPWLVHAEVERVAPGLAAHVSLTEACLLRPWPGNVRELCAEVRSAAQAALLVGAARVEAKHLSETAGRSFSRQEEPASVPPPARSTRESRPVEREARAPSRATLVELLRRCRGNVSAAARELGVHRTQLRRWMDRHGLDARSTAGPKRGPGRGGGE
ncbi:MAG: sigma 54-interacting transcriptional regulator [Polyangiaceae bacterium]